MPICPPWTPGNGVISSRLTFTDLGLALSLICLLTWQVSSPSLGLSFPHLQNGNRHPPAYHLTGSAGSFLVAELPSRHAC